MGDKLYITVDSSGMGYKNLPSRYFAKIDRNTQKLKIINSDTLVLISTAYNPISKNLYSITRNPYTGQSSIIVFGKDSMIQILIRFKLLGLNQIYINSDGFAYITQGDILHNTGNGSSVIVFDTRTQKIIKQIATPSGPNNISTIDRYLFISDYNSNSVSVIDIKNNKIIGTIQSITRDNSNIMESIVIK